VGLTNLTPKRKLNVKKPEAIPAGRNKLRRQMAGHSKSGQGLKRTVVAQKKNHRVINVCVSGGIAACNLIISTKRW
jgi:hypothetical protein